MVIHQLVDVLAPFYKDGRHIPDLLKPREHVAVDSAVRGGEPVIEGTRIPAAEVAAPRPGRRPPGPGQRLLPRVSAAAARDAVELRRLRRQLHRRFSAGRCLKLLLDENVTPAHGRDRAHPFDRARCGCTSMN
ncbi:hypothetical protein ACRAWF_31465 [Streptomyces sp. L7]